MTNAERLSAIAGDPTRWTLPERAALLDGASVLSRGPELAMRIGALTAERDQLRAEVEWLRGELNRETYRCIFCDYVAAGLMGLRQHSAICDKHPTTARAEAAEKDAEIARGSRAEIMAQYEQLTQLCKATEERERAALATDAGLRLALEEYADETQWGLTHDNARHCDWFMSRGLPADKQDGWAIAKAALAASPDDHARRKSD